ncbi:hypothetical protein [Streptomyces sp. Ncost-T10-10d]|uniref:hypothetical protein n=1 Tax=Streptomyces sp. Ncost-T10-10d TaxID=1839774 RepID=UPI00081E401F|nr:hypothetical protein [Streptomyces sp. Ncost-T10-10d]SCF72976.1 hypothetical protein GA0115254_11417 [Streptomyces sp. Ncost-T10-10d]
MGTSNINGPSSKGNYALVTTPAGTVTGFWFREPRDAQNMDLIAALLAKHDQTHLLSVSSHVVENTIDDKGGAFVLFDN